MCIAGWGGPKSLPPQQKIRSTAPTIPRNKILFRSSRGQKLFSRNPKLFTNTAGQNPCHFWKTTFWPRSSQNPKVWSRSGGRLHGEEFLRRWQGFWPELLVQSFGFREVGLRCWWAGFWIPGGVARILPHGGFPSRSSHPVMQMSRPRPDPSAHMLLHPHPHRQGRVRVRRSLPVRISIRCLYPLFKEN